MRLSDKGGLWIKHMPNRKVRKELVMSVNEDAFVLDSIFYLSSLCSLSKRYFLPVLVLSTTFDCRAALQHRGSDRFGLRWNPYAVSSLPGFFSSVYVTALFCASPLSGSSASISLFRAREIAVCIRGEVHSHILQSFEIGQVDISAC